MILYISAEKKEGRAPLGAARIYLLLTVVCALFGAVYECFSHDVWSFWMVYAFAFPLAGALFFSFLEGKKRRIPVMAAECIHCGLSSLAAGSLIRGALQIYGTASPLLPVFFIVGAGMLMIAGGMMLLRHRAGTEQ